MVLGSWEVGRELGMIEVEMDMKIVSVANMRLHWAAKARLVKSQRARPNISDDGRAGPEPHFACAGRRQT